MAGGMTRVGSHPTLQSYASSLPRLGTGVPPSPGPRSPRLPQAPGVDTGALLALGMKQQGGCWLRAAARLAGSGLG